MAAGALVVPLVALAIALAAGSGGGKTDVKLKAAYDAGFAKGKSDAINGMAEQLNPAVGVTGASPAQVAAYEQGYKDGYAANKKTAPVVKKKPPITQTNGKDTETAAYAYNRGLAQGRADGLQDGTAGNAYGSHHTASTYNVAALRNSYEQGWEAAYANGYAQGKQIADDGGGIVMGDVLGTQGGNPSDFKPHTPYAAPYARRGLPRHWYNM